MNNCPFFSQVSCTFLAHGYTTFCFGYNGFQWVSTNANIVYYKFAQNMHLIMVFKTMIKILKKKDSHIISLESVIISNAPGNRFLYNSSSLALTSLSCVIFGSYHLVQQLKPRKKHQSLFQSSLLIALLSTNEQKLLFLFKITKNVLFFRNTCWSVTWASGNVRHDKSVWTFPL